MPKRGSLVIALTLSACSPGEPQTSTTGVTTKSVGSTGDASSTSSVASSSSSDASSDDSSSTTTDPTTSTTTGATSSASGPFTTGEPPDFETTDEPPVGCGGKIDFLFVIDRDKTMEDQVGAIQASLPGFVETIESEFEQFDLHIMAVAADSAYWGIEECETQCFEEDWLSCAPIGPEDYPCYAYVDPVLDECDWTWGAGVTFPAAFGASNKRCQLAGGNRYIIDEELDLYEAFDCIAQMGIQTKNGALPALAMRQALKEENLGPGGCNEGFLRDDALLVVTFLTDTSDNLSPGEPEDWAHELRVLKDFDDDAIVILGLIPDVYEPNNVCPGPGPGNYLPPLNTLLTLLPHTVLGSICSDEFVSFFEQAAAEVLAVCEQYIPK